MNPKYLDEFACDLSPDESLILMDILVQLNPKMFLEAADGWKKVAKDILDESPAALQEQAEALGWDD